MDSESTRRLGVIYAVLCVLFIAGGVGFLLVGRNGIHAFYYPAIVWFFWAGKMAWEVRRCLAEVSPRRPR
jgi:hypothetical protein